LFKLFLITSGGLGQLGTGLAKILRQKYGKDNVIMSDILKPSKEVVEAGKFTKFNIIYNFLCLT
jgi:threonine 3-dehydrogenase